MKEITRDYCVSVLRSKGVEESEMNLKAVEAALKKGYSRIYHAVCINIDNTLTPLKEVCRDNSLLDILASLTYYGINLCFITGRSENRTKEFLLPLIRALKSRYPEYGDDMFLSWIAVTNNGTYRLRTEDPSKGFFESKVDLIDGDKLKVFLNPKIKDALRESICKRISENTEQDYDELIESSKRHGSHTTLRFLLPYSPNYSNKEICSLADLIRESAIKIYEEYAKKEFDGYITTGIYNDDETLYRVFEVSMNNKGQAVSEIEKELGIPQNTMLRIGDQGGVLGNDYEMLAGWHGFSAGVISDSIEGCFPILGDNYEVLKGRAATIQILRDIIICPAICLHKKDKEKYINELTKMEMRARKYTRRTIEDHGKWMKPWIDGIEADSMYDVFDKASGGVCLADCEWRSLEMYKKSVIFELFTKRIDTRDKSGPAYMYSVLNEDHMVLRGPVIYYKGLALIEDEKSKINKVYVREWMNDTQRFIHSVKQAIEKDAEKDYIDKYLGRKLLLGIMDNIRNILLLWYNFILEDRTRNRNVIYRIEEDGLTSSIYKLTKQNCEYMYRLLFGGMYGVSLNDYCKLLDACTQVYTDVYKRFSELENEGLHVFDRALRKWREIDNFMENVMAVGIAMKQFWKRLNSKEKPNEENLVMAFYGMRYGGIELPIIAEVISEKQYWHVKVEQYIISQEKKNYADKQMQAEDEVEYEVSNTIRRSNAHFVFDDNIATGKTLQLAINGLIKKSISIDGIAVVRYPTINRIEQMFDGDESSAPNLELFFKGVHGLVMPAPYSRLNRVGCFGSGKNLKYLDEVGVFDLNRNAICRALFKNGSYVMNSEVEVSMRCIATNNKL